MEIEDGWNSPKINRAKMCYSICVDYTLQCRKEKKFTILIKKRPDPNIPTALLNLFLRYSYDEIIFRS